MLCTKYLKTKAFTCRIYKRRIKVAVSGCLLPIQSERLNANIKPLLHKPVMTYAYPAWQFAADTYLSKSSACKQGSPHCWQFCEAHTVRDLHVAFKILDVLDFITKLCRQEAEVIQNHHHCTHVRNTGQGEAQHGRYKRLILCGGQAFERSND
jgi:hypothetical protein